MKKSLIALAALAAVGSSFAQSSVTLYGRMDLGFATNKTTDVVGTTTTTTKNTSLVGAEGSRSTNRFGVRGSEDLGGGLKLNFGVETKMFADPKNKNNDQLFGSTRTYILQMAGSFGKVTVGTYSGNSIDNLRSYSVSAAGIAGGDHANTVMDDNRGAATRSVNAIGYRSPDFGGLTFGIGTSNEKKDVNGSVTKSSGYMGDVTYSAGPLSMMLAAAQGKARVDPTTNTKIDDVGFAASYDLGMAVPYFLIEQAKNTVASGATIKSSVAEIGSKFPMGALTPYITLSKGKIKTSATNREDKTTAFQIGTTYDLSKRSYVYVGIGQEKQKNNVTADNTKKTGAALGLVHNF